MVMAPDALSKPVLDELIDLQRRRLILERMAILSDVVSTMNALVQAERASYTAVDVAQTVTSSGGTATLINQVMSPGQIGIYNPLAIVPNVSNVFTATVVIDTQPFFADSSLLQTEIIPLGQWLPIYQSLVLKVVNNDTSNDVIHALGGFYQMRVADWRRIQTALRLGAMVALYPYYELPPDEENPW